MNYQRRYDDPLTIDDGGLPAGFPTADIKEWLDGVTHRSFTSMFELLQYELDEPGDCGKLLQAIADLLYEREQAGIETPDRYFMPT